MANALKAQTPEILQFGADGMPLDPEMKSIAMCIRALAETRSKRAIPNYIDWARSWMPPKFKKSPHLQVVMDTMLASGVFEEVKYDGYCLVDAKRKAGGTAEERQDNLAGAVRGIAERVCETEHGRAVASKLTLQLKKLRVIHKTTVDGRNCLVIPRVIRLGTGGPYLEKAFALHVSETGVILYKLSAASIAVKFEDGEPSLSVDLTNARRDVRWQALLDESYVNPFSGSPDEYTEQLNKELRQSLGKLGGDRSVFEAVTGEKVKDKAWNSYVKSVGRGKSPYGLARRMLFAVLDMETRRYGMRHPNARVSLYNWFCPKSEVARVRRRQASDSFPMFSTFLPAIQMVIDKGEPLLPALSEATGLTPSLLRLLQGYSWQKVRKSFPTFQSYSKGKETSEFLSSVPPERLPSLTEWPVVWELMGYKARWGMPFPRNFAKNCSNDWEKTSKRLSHPQWNEAIRDVVSNLHPALTGVLKQNLHAAVRKDQNWAIERLLVEHIFGEHMGGKRMKSFIDEWHGAVTRTTAGMQTIRRKAFQGVIYRWDPLIGESYECESGKLVWLTDEDQLLDEGVLMQHCVGSYSSKCMHGLSHIASVFGSDGSRSTVEIVPELTELRVVQHQAFRNTTPSGDVNQVLSTFLTACPKSEWIGKVINKEDRKKLDPIEEKFVEIDGETRLRILRLYDQCLPKSLKGRSLEWWLREYDRVNKTVSFNAFEADEFIQMNDF